MALPAVRSSYTPQLLRWDPFREFDDLFGQLTRLTGSTTWSPLADVSETDDEYLIELDLPGVRREDVDIELNRDELGITGELKEQEREGLFHRRTRRTGKFAYRISLPPRVDTTAVDASMADGVLTVRVPKSQEAKPRRIAVS
ncbi:MAG TPA: Hsp20/alpha crystallin family protein [Amycolatopsis sp.]|uniref:Hsp20/alpha crystallin family protein n=1 Tax=Amycolatopsis sp. TaxID=37632 RepID=UPI002B4A3879|nr:Hsp20/alpha crystallin family protein [Amycolatopsis sp.]HKS44393.1 Hsp20/alpha crystallin family protein [Amycolatopsis sp.]